MIGLRGAVAVVAVALAGTGVAADRAEATGPQRALVQTYSPITMLREQDDPPCDNDREQFEPTTVNTVLGNPAGGAVARRPPAAARTRSRRPPRPTSPARATATTSTSRATR